MTAEKPPAAQHALPDAITPTALVTVHYAKTHLSRLLREVADGTEYVISRGDTPVARLVPIQRDHAPERAFGVLAESLRVPAAFFTPLSDEELDAWDTV